jgi:hypothetical protein
MPGRRPDARGLHFLSAPNDTVFSKVEFEENYSRIAVGNVARAIDDPGCCYDYVLAGPEADNVRVVFGSPLGAGRRCLRRGDGRCDR